MLLIQNYVASSMVVLSTMDDVTQSYPVIAATVALLALATLGDVTHSRLCRIIHVGSVHHG
jgi:hypothetical protein